MINKENEAQARQLEEQQATQGRYSSSTSQAMPWQCSNGSCHPCGQGSAEPAEEEAGKLTDLDGKC
jgi:hypothetical protein